MVASFNEKLVVNNGQVVSPQSLKGSTAQVPPSLNQIIYQINNEKDFDDFAIKKLYQVPSDQAELQYVKHPTLAPKTQPVMAAAASIAAVQGSQSQSAPSYTSATPAQLESTPPPQQYQPPPQSEPLQQPNFSSYDSGFTPQQQPYQLQPPYPTSSSAFSPPTQNPYAQADFSRGPPGQAQAQQTSGVTYNSAPVHNSSSAPPVNPVFGVSLEDLFRRDGSPVPMVVYQCIQAVDLFGLEVEGIYRIPGTTSHIQTMKALFDSGEYKFALDIHVY
jgi:hypothetical protein